MSMTLEQQAAWDQLQRDIDDGLQPYVIGDGQPTRVPLAAEILQQFGVTSGQTVSQLLLAAMLDTQMAHSQLVMTPTTARH